MFLTFERSRSLSRLVCLFADASDEAELRLDAGEELLRLLDADHYASFAWNDVAGVFDHRVAISRVDIDMGEDQLRAYENYFQFREPVIHPLCQRRDTALVAQVPPPDHLAAAEFFNHVPVTDGLYWGVHVFAWDGQKNIGDMRIWRRRSRGRFDHEAIELLELIRPAFTSALRRLRTEVLKRRSAAHGVQPAPVDVAKLQKLTPREMEVAELAAQGISDKAIGARLGIGFPTVRTHVSHIFEKLQVENRVQLVRKLAAWAPVAR